MVRLLKGGVRAVQLNVKTCPRSDDSRFGSAFKANLRIVKAMLHGLFFVPTAKKKRSVVLHLQNAFEQISHLSPASYKLAIYAAAYGLAAIAHKGFGVLLFFGLAHGLPSSEYARFGLLYALQTGLITIATAGIVEVVIGQHAMQVNQGEGRPLYEVGNGLFVWLLPLATLVGVGIYSGFLLDYATVWDFLLILTGAGLLAFFMLQATFFRLEEAHRPSLLLSFVPPVMGLALAYGVFLVWGTLTSFFGGMAVALLVMFGMLHWQGLIHVRANLRVSNLVFVRQELPPYILIGLLLWVTGYGSTYLVESFFNLAYVAKFTFAYTLSSALQLVATALNQVWSPRFFRLINAQPADQLERRNVLFYGWMGVVMGVVGGGLLILLRPAIDLFGGQLRSYRDITHGLDWLFAGYIVSIPWWHAQNYFYAHKEGGALLKRVSMATGLGLFAWVGLMLVLQEAGIYLGFCGLMLIRSLAVFEYAHKRWGIRLAWHGPALGGGLLLAGRLIGDRLG